MSMIWLLHLTRAKRKLAFRLSPSQAAKMSG